jgi:hypothetical protein
MSARHLLLALALSSSFVAACAADPEEESAGYDVSAAGSLSAKVPGMTIWVDPVVQPDWRYDQRVWLVHGRTSKNLASTFSYASDDEIGEALVTSARKFEVVLDSPSMVRLLDGMTLYVEIQTTTGAETRYFASIALSPRFTRFAGSSKIFLQSAIDPIVVGGDTLYRGRLSLGSGTTDITAEGAGAPEAFVKNGSKYTFDWTWPNLIAAAGSTDAVVHFGAQGSSGALTKDARIELAVTGLRLQTTVPPQPEFACDPHVRTCLEGLAPGDEDASSCGQALQVKNCSWDMPRVTGPQRFAHDLRSYMLGWYWDHAADVAASEGAPLIVGLSSVHASSAELVTDPAEDPHGHDLAETIVYVHPDVVFPGSDRRWFAAYDRESGMLEQVYDFE